MDINQETLSFASQVPKHGSPSSTGPISYATPDTTLIHHCSAVNSLNVLTPNDENTLIHNQTAEFHQ